MRETLCMLKLLELFLLLCSDQILQLFRSYNRLWRDWRWDPML